MTQLETIGNTIRNKRREYGYSLEELSALCGVERSQIGKIEKGLIPGVTYITIDKIYNSLGMGLIPSELNNPRVDLHPVVKWAGGKTQLLSIISQYLPESFNHYYEPFVGGGALLFKLQPKEFTINDINGELTSVYKCLCDNSLFEELKAKLEEHETNHSEDYFYKIREMDRLPNYQDLPITTRAARMIYLNKAGFNGLYRVNGKGYFNVPSGKKTSVTCFDRDNFENIHKFLNEKESSILNGDFASCVASAKEGDFVYFDPPYDTREDKDSFTAYDKDSFGKDAQIKLANLYKLLSDRGVKVMLSNHNTAFINELYKDFKIHVVPAKRMINSKASGRGNVEEVLITNYE